MRQQLRNKHVAGICWHNGREVAVGKWLPIIPRAQWDFAQELLTFRSAAAQKKRARNRAPRAYILRGLVICGNCGTVMAGCSGTRLPLLARQPPRRHAMRADHARQTAGEIRRRCGHHGY